MKPKFKKIRGHKRIWRETLKWIHSESKLDVDNLKRNGYSYTKVFIQPWDSLSLINSQIPEPKKKTKNNIVNGLLEIYNSWKIQLENLNEPYYLKIWLFDPRISKSQVVCAIGEKIKYYNGIFHKLNFEQKPKDYNNLLNKKLNWEIALDEDSYWEEELMWPIEMYEDPKDYFHAQRLLKKAEQKEFRTQIFDEDGIKDKFIFINRGKIWVGGK